jgi:5-methyltetrahydropteroyltriglutamate--homocysteine methyltransferase
MIKTTVHGFYPKISEDPALPNYRRARNRLDSGEISDADFNQVVQATIKRAVDEQIEAGIDLPTDGQIQWDDLVSPFARTWKNTAVGGLIRFFDNNTYYRRAQINGDVSVNTPAAAADFRVAQAAASRPLKAVLPGPLTFGCPMTTTTVTNASACAPSQQR